MPTLVLLLLLCSFAASCAVTWVALRLGTRAGAFDSAPRAGQAKAAARRVPNIGGVGVFAGIVLPLVGGIAAVFVVPPDMLGPFAEHAAGLRGVVPAGLALLGALGGLHALGLVDDRRPLGPLVKLLVMVGAAAVVVMLTDTRLLTAVDGVAGGAWLSIALTVGWLVVVTNAVNFLDNMDGLAAGICAVAGGCMIAAALLAEQWFVAAAAGTVVGSCLGFLVWNRPPARIFMGDGGSLVLGFLLGVLAVRTTYTGVTPEGVPIDAGWYGVFAPLLILAVPLYDFVSVFVIRIRQGRSPMLGDLQHVSHRLVKRGIGRGTAVVLLWILTAITGIGGVVLGHAPAWGAVLLGVQAFMLLVVLAVLEVGTSPPGARWDSLEAGRDG